jgi:ribonuclease VapC
MPRTVLDSSALLAFINGEPGGEAVAPLLADATISAVNLAEVIGKLIGNGVSQVQIDEMLNMIRLTVVDFDQRQAKAAGILVAQTRKFGLSLGDRACLVLAANEGVPAVTADRAWQGIGTSAGVEIQFIR